MRRILLILNAILMAVCCYADGKYNVFPSDFGNNYVLRGRTVKVPITINNTGAASVRTISYVITRDGVESAQRTVSVSVVSRGTGEATITFKADSVARKSSVTFAITKVNSQPNECEDAVSSGNIITITEKPVVVPVVEEFTGTWCGWCPIGFDGVENAHATFGDKVALIAIHCSDIMECSDFSALNGRVSGYPGAIIDMIQGDFYPSTGEVKDKINQQIQNKIAGATIKVTAEWTTSAQKYINITTKTKFVFSDDNANYAIAYALTEDGMHGTGSSWAQNNNLSGNSNYAKSNPFWYNSPSKVTDIKFNHVGVAAWGIEKGINGSVPTSVVAGEELEYTYKANISNNKLIQDKSNLKVIVMLIDRSTGTIVNAAQTAIEDYTTGIADIDVEESPMSSQSEGQGGIYDLNGRRVSAPQRGINIIRMPDGTVRKVMGK